MEPEEVLVSEAEYFQYEAELLLTVWCYAEWGFEMWIGRLSNSLLIMTILVVNQSPRDKALAERLQLVM